MIVSKDWLSKATEKEKSEEVYKKIKDILYQAGRTKVAIQTPQGIIKGEAPYADRINIEIKPNEEGKFLEFYDAFLLLDYSEMSFID